jgi:hypothetical protein
MGDKIIKYKVYRETKEQSILGIIPVEGAIFSDISESSPILN